MKEALLVERLAELENGTISWNPRVTASIKVLICGIAKKHLALATASNQKLHYSKASTIRIRKAPRVRKRCMTKLLTVEHEDQPSPLQYLMNPGFGTLGLLLSPTPKGRMQNKTSH